MREFSRKKIVCAIFLVIVLIHGLTTGCIKVSPMQTTTSSATTYAKTNTLNGSKTAMIATTGSLSEASMTSSETTLASKTSTDESSCLPESTLKAEFELRLTIICDNYDYDPYLKTEWGFSCLIEGPERVVLFDAGADYVTLLGNMRELELDPSMIDAVVLSHNHNDHIGGLYGLLEDNHDVIVYLPASFSGNLKDKVKSFGAEVEEISEAKELFSGIYSTGEMGNEISEQSLIMTTSQGLVIITGCAHPGIVNIVRKAQDMLTNKPVYLALGGFHMAWDTVPENERIIKTLRQLGVLKVAPCHCSGDETRKLFENEYGENYINSGAGKIIVIP